LTGPNPAILALVLWWVSVIFNLHMDNHVCLSTTYPFQKLLLYNKKLKINM
jgi:hypothetical protein